MGFRSRRPELAELLLEDLPRRVLGERAEELDRLGDFVGRARVVADLPELLRGDAPALLQHHVGLHGFAADRVGHADDRRLLHGRVAEEHLLDLARRSPTRSAVPSAWSRAAASSSCATVTGSGAPRSEERRVGKEGELRGWTVQWQITDRVR